MFCFEMAVNLKVPHHLQPPPARDSHGGLYYITLLRKDIKEWLRKENINFSYSTIYSILWFENEEDKVRFILKWI